MKLLALIGFALCLAACGPRITGVQLASCMEYCKDVGGLSHVDVYTIFGLPDRTNCVCGNRKSGDSPMRIQECYTLSLSR